MKKNGFTLIEMLIAVAIIGVLAAIATPLYQNYVIRAERADLQRVMLQVAQKLESYKVQNYGYDGAALSSSAIFSSTERHVSVTGATGSQYRYELVLTLDTANGNGTVGGWTLVATPENGSAGDGVVKLNSQGWRCWTKTATACTLSATSNWDK